MTPADLTRVVDAAALRAFKQAAARDVEVAIAMDNLRAALDAQARCSFYPVFGR